jgi:hypothetical protein
MAVVALTNKSKKTTRAGHDVNDANGDDFEEPIKKEGRNSSSCDNKHTRRRGHRRQHQERQRSDKSSSSRRHRSRSSEKVEADISPNSNSTGTSATTESSSFSPSSQEDDEEQQQYKVYARPSLSRQRLESTLNETSSELAAYAKAVITVNQEDNERRKGRGKSPGRLEGRTKSPGRFERRHDTGKSPGRLGGRTKSPGRLDGHQNRGVGRSKSPHDLRGRSPGRLRVRSPNGTRSGRSSSEGKYSNRNSSKSPGRYKNSRTSSPGKYTDNKTAEQIVRQSRSSSTDRLSKLIESKQTHNASRHLENPTMVSRARRTSRAKDMLQTGSEHSPKQGRRYISSSRHRRHGIIDNDDDFGLPRRSKSLENIHECGGDDDNAWNCEFEWDFEGDGDFFEEIKTPSAERKLPTRSASNEELRRPSLKKTKSTSMSMADVSKILKQSSSDDKLVKQNHQSKAKSSRFPSQSATTTTTRRNATWNYLTPNHIETKKKNVGTTNATNVSGKVSFFEELTKHNPKDFAVF